VSGFSAEWLALREPFDVAARSALLVDELSQRLAPRSAGTALEIVDLGAGAGSNLRYLAPRLRGAQRWRLIDHDEALLSAALATTRVWAEARGAQCTVRGATLTLRGAGLECEIACEQRDLRDLAKLQLPTGALVTAAALLDLVSARWLELLAAQCRTALASLCFVLTYDGRTTCDPPESEDASVLEAFNRHQLGDKGFGPALGPGAPIAAVKSFERNGFRVSTAASDWRIGQESAAMQTALLDGWRNAAVELAPDRRTQIEDWHTHRCRHVANGASSLTIGHVDVVGWL
jgi:hypothetical protein